MTLILYYKNKLSTKGASREMNFTDYFYKSKWGYYPYEEYINYDKTESFIRHLQDNKFTNDEIFQIIEEADKNPYLSIEDMDDKWWEPYLTEKNKFYFHNTLRLQPKKPMWNPLTGEVKVEKFYLEMVIKYSINDLLNYYYITVNTPVPLRDYKRDKAGLEHLLKKYNNMKNITSLDFVLHLIDMAKRMNVYVSSSVELNQCEAETYDHLMKVVAESELDGVNKIIWREI